MKANKVMKLLNICRSTLYLYTKSGKIKTVLLDNGYYDYDDASVFKLMKKDNRTSILYARVSTYKQKNDLKKQVLKLKQFCDEQLINNFTVHSEISSGLNLDRKEFSKIIDKVVNYQVKTIYITNKDRLTRLSFRSIKEIFAKFGTTIVAINDSHSTYNDNEIFEELISLMHIFSTTLYSKRRKNKINIYKRDIMNFLEPS